MRKSRQQNIKESEARGQRSKHNFLKELGVGWAWRYKRETDG